LFSFCCRCPVLRLHGGGREKKRPKRDVSSSQHPIPDGDDPLDSDYNAKEEMGCKKEVLYKRRSKNASNAPISHQSASHKHRREPSPSPPSSSLTSQSSSSSGGGGDDSDEDKEEQERDESDDGNEEEVMGAGIPIFRQVEVTIVVAENDTPIRLQIERSNPAILAP